MGVLAVVELPFQTGLARDKATNTFAFAEANPGHANGDGFEEGLILDAVQNIYETPHAELDDEALGFYLSPCLDRSANAGVIKLYDITGHLDGSPHGSPFAMRNITIADSTSVNGLPEEVALVVTLEAKDRADQRIEVPDGVDPGTAVDRPRQRYTGRTYFGPWGLAETQSDAFDSARPKTLLCAGLRALVARCAVEVDDASGDLISLGVWSRSDQAIRGITHVRTDDAWDTQRRRGVSPLAVTREAIAGIGVPELELAS